MTSNRDLAIGLGKRLFDDTIWKIMLLSDPDVPFNQVRPMVNAGLVRAGTRVSTVVLATRVEHALGMAITHAIHPFTLQDARVYAEQLHEPDSGVPNTTDYVTILKACADRPALGAICANHLLMHQGEGVFAIDRHDTQNYLQSLAGDNDGLRRFVENHAVERIPGGLTWEKARRNNAMESCGTSE